MKRLLAWLLSFWPDDPNLDRSDDWEPRPVSEPACIRCPRPQIGKSLAHGAYVGATGDLTRLRQIKRTAKAGPLGARLIADIEGKP